MITMHEWKQKQKKKQSVGIGAGCIGLIHGSIRNWIKNIK